MSSKNYEDFIVGGIASGISRCVIAPLDVVKIRFQVQKGSGNSRKYRGVTQALRTIVAEEGIRALWKGNVPALLMVAPWGAVSFLVTQQTKAAWHKMHPKFAQDYPHGLASHEVKHLVTNQDPTPILSFFASSLGGVCATVVTYPLDLMRTRFAVQPGNSGYSSIFQGFKQVIQTNGLRGLYAGLPPTLLGVAPYMGLNYGLYDACRATMRSMTSGLDSRSPGLKKILDGSESAISGGIAGTLSKLITMPFDVVKKHMQTEAHVYSFDEHIAAKNAAQGNASYMCVSNSLPTNSQKSTWQHVRALVDAHGIRGLFRGCWPSLVKAAPGSAVIFATYEGTLKLLIKSREQRKPEK